MQRTKKSEMDWADAMWIREQLKKQVLDEETHQKQYKRL